MLWASSFIPLMAPLCNRKYFGYKTLNFSEPFYSSPLSLSSSLKIYKDCAPSAKMTGRVPLIVSSKAQISSSP